MSVDGGPEDERKTIGRGGAVRVGVEAASPTGPRAGARWAVRGRVPLLCAGALLLLLALVLAVPGLFTDHDPNATDVVRTFQAPGAGHLLGTDQLGRDVFARLVYGTRISVAVSAAATAIGVGGGALLGLLAAVGTNRADALLMRVVDVLMAFPETLLALLVVAVLGGGTLNVAVAIGLAGIPGYARLVRGQARLVLGSEYVDSAKVLGVPPWRYLLRHVLPNIGGSVVVLASIGSGAAIASGAGLSLLGLGPRPPQADWGSMVADGKDFLQTAWWISVAPGVLISLVVVAATAIGRHLQASAVR
ncbi:ABC transporter permease [Streptomyces sp. MMS24-I2-30]|uniref:ABC transporter permease n=1 Tax=Streptomyces sp. MMS24-I2-30 TaxID=3351564 RepID=UPI0010C40EA1|nr:ABC transporter [Streptomyces sp.]